MSIPKPTTYRVLSVAAVSTDAQATDDKASLPQQLADNRAACNDHGWMIVREVVIHHSRNYEWLHALMNDCPDYAAMVGLIEREEVDLLCCRDYDRLWRTVSLQSQLMALCRQHGVQVYALNHREEPLPPESLARRGTALSPLIMSWLAEQENIIRSKRHRTGMEARIRAGQYNAGRPAYGYRRDPDGLLVVNETEAVWIRWVYEQRAKGWGYDRIVAGLNERHAPTALGGRWAYTSVRSILHNDLYRGGVRWGTAYNPNAEHEAIIDDALWQQVQSVNENRATVPIASPYALTGLVKCGQCGAGVSYAHRGPGHCDYLRCNHYGRSRELCDAGRWRVDEIEQAVLAAVRDALDNPGAWRQAQEEAHNGNGHTELVALNSQIAEVENGRARWDRLFERGGIDAAELMAHRQRLGSDLADLIRRRDELAASVVDFGKTAQTLADLHDMLGSLDDLPPPELRELYGALIARIDLYKDPVRLTIRWL